jgi:hypothetical protein
MDKPPQLLRTQRRTFSAHHMLMNAANLQLEAARANDTSRFNHSLGAMIMSALAVEALANSVGDRVVPRWQDFESLSPIGKIRLLTDRLQIDFDRNTEPWATVQWLGVFRNRIAHAKPEEVTERQITTQEQADRDPFRVPHSKLERDVTVGNAARAVNAVYALKDVLCSRLTSEQAFGISADMWTDGLQVQ